MARQVSLAEARALAGALAGRVRLGGRLLAARRVVLVGSGRRGRPLLKDVDVLLVARRAEVDLASLQVEGLAVRAQGRARRRLSCVVTFRGKNFPVDFFLAYDEEMPFALFHHTGSAAYNVRMRARAKARGWRLNQYGLFVRATGRRVRGSAGLRSEEQLAEFLGVTARPPEARTR